MLDFMNVIATVIKDWWLLIFFFTAGGIWWQLKTWFNRVNKTMDAVGQQHDQQNIKLDLLHTKVVNIESKVEKIEQHLDRVHEEVHDQEIKLAVLEASPQKSRRKS